jgi:hypothetical protein
MPFRYGFASRKTFVHNTRNREALPTRLPRQPRRAHLTAATLFLGGGSMQFHDVELAAEARREVAGVAIYDKWGHRGALEPNLNSKTRF